MKLMIRFYHWLIGKRLTEDNPVKVRPEDWDHFYDDDDEAASFVEERGDVD